MKMRVHNTFKDLIKFNDNLKKEEILILFFHSSILDHNFIYELEDKKKSLIIENENMKISEGYIRYIADNNKEKVFIGRILIDPEWRKNSNNYNFIYKNHENNNRYILNISKIDNSLVLHVINISEPSSIHSVTIKINEYIKNNNEINIENIEESIKIQKLENIFQTHILGNMKFNHNSNVASTNLINKFNVNELPNPKNNIRQDSHFIKNFNDDNFDDKNPVIRESILPNYIKQIPILKPDGLLVGPNNRFFDPKNLRYDPIGPFGLEPNADTPTKFPDNFPF
ncbi:conserved Plasmodium protein, unknown function [Plasmodium gallinaceum]|uniref:PI31 proteasome regulator N-terminal domain-containing protein n=1 Tax=Plasmodium gallinaceum TaxID=5849 RepID=A0A1J1GS74_PLAGA|nr:conserved Plasmodium protein, unknown function [Plasmodium gallinaceum]CRG94160.1 conserved Plasmodium protein, unknown function [Plasmodium gallinaceum]